MGDPAQTYFHFCGVSSIVLYSAVFYWYLCKDSKCKFSLTSLSGLASLWLYVFDTTKLTNHSGASTGFILFIYSYRFPEWCIVVSNNIGISNISISICSASLPISDFIYPSCKIGTPPPPVFIVRVSGNSPYLSVISFNSNIPLVRLHPQPNNSTCVGVS